MATLGEVHICPWWRTMTLLGLAQDLLPAHAAVVRVLGFVK